MQKQFTIEEVDEKLVDIIDDQEAILFEEESDSHQIWLTNVFIRIPEIRVDIYEGEYCQYDEEESSYNADFTIYIFKELGTDAVVYSEGYSSLTAAVTNYCSQNNLKISIDSLKCNLISE